MRTPTTRNILEWVEGLGLRVLGLGFRLEGFRFRVCFGKLYTKMPGSFRSWDLSTIVHSVGTQMGTPNPGKPSPRLLKPHELVLRSLQAMPKGTPPRFRTLLGLIQPCIIVLISSLNPGGVPLGEVLL